MRIYIFLTLQCLLTLSYDLSPGKDAWKWKIIPYHRVYIVPPSSFVEVKLPESQKGITLNAEIETLPKFGTLYQISQVYNEHGHEPKFDRGNIESKILENATSVYGYKNNLVYALPTEYEYSLTPAHYSTGMFQFYASIKYIVRFERSSVIENQRYWGEYDVQDSYFSNQAATGYITFVNEDKIFLRSLFTFGNEKWQVINNNLCIGDKYFTDYYISDRRGEEYIEDFDLFWDEEYRRYPDGTNFFEFEHKFSTSQSCGDPTNGRIGQDNSQLLGLSRFVYGTDREVDYDESEVGEAENKRWYFKAPEQYHGDWTIMYGGKIQFWMASYGGDFRQPKYFNRNLDVVVLECESCTFGGSRLVYRIQPDDLDHPIIRKMQNNDFEGFEVSLEISAEDPAWIIYSLNGIEEPYRPTNCQLVEFLAKIDGFLVLGDYLREVETIGIDDIEIRIGEVGHDSGPPKECYCVYPGIRCADVEFIKLN